MIRARIQVEYLDAPAKDTKEIPSQAIIIKTRGGKRSGRSLTDGEKGEGRREKGEARQREDRCLSCT